MFDLVTDPTTQGVDFCSSSKAARGFSATFLINGLPAWPVSLGGHPCPD